LSNIIDFQKIVDRADKTPPKSTEEELLAEALVTRFNVMVELYQQQVGRRLDERGLAALLTHEEQVICQMFAQAEQARMLFDARKLDVHESDLSAAAACVVRKYGNGLRRISDAWNHEYRPKLEHALNMATLKLK